MAIISLNTKATSLQRDILASFLPNPRAITAFENIALDVTETLPDAISAIIDITAEIQASPIITWDNSEVLEGSRKLVEGGGISFALTDSNFTVSIKESGVTPDNYGGDDKLVSLSIDSTGRITSASSHDIYSDVIIEGINNLFFTLGRVHQALSGIGGIAYNDAGVFSADKTWFDDRYVQTESTSAWSKPTGQSSRATFAVYEAPTISNPPTQAEVQAIANGLQNVSRALSALISDLIEIKALVE